MGERREQKRLNYEKVRCLAVFWECTHYKPLSRHLVVASSGGIYVWDGDSFNTIKTGWGNIDTCVLLETCANYMVAFNGINTPVKWDGVAVSDLLNAPADGQFPTLHKETLFVVPKSHPSELWWSESFNPEEWPPDYYWRVKDGDGDVITCLHRLYDDQIVFKGRSIHIFRGTNLDDFSLYELEPEYWVVLVHGRLLLIKTGVYFISEEGLFGV